MGSFFFINKVVKVCVHPQTELPHVSIQINERETAILKMPNIVNKTNKSVIFIVNSDNFYLFWLEKIGFISFFPHLWYLFLT